MDKREKLVKILEEARYGITIYEVLAERIEALYAPRPFSLDPNSEEYVMPAIGSSIDVYSGTSVMQWYYFSAKDAFAVSNGMYKEHFWLPSRTASDFIK